MATKSEVKGVFPEEALTDLIGMLKGDKKFDRWAAIGAAIKLADYLSGLIGGGSSVKSYKAGRYSKAETLKALEGLKPVPGGAKAAGIPAWLVPILLKLAQKWLEGKV